MTSHRNGGGAFIKCQRKKQQREKKNIRQSDAGEKMKEIFTVSLLLLFTLVQSSFKRKNLIY